MEVVLTSRSGGYVTSRMKHQPASLSPVPRPVLIGSDPESLLVFNHCWWRRSRHNSILSSVTWRVCSSISCQRLVVRYSMCRAKHRRDSEFTTRHCYNRIPAEWTPVALCNCRIQWGGCDKPENRQPMLTRQIWPNGFVPLIW